MLVFFFFWSLLICASSFNVLVIMFYVHICFTLVIRAREGRRQWRKVWSPSGTRHLCTLMSIAGISENTCWRLLCGTNPEYKMRRVTFWEKYEAYINFVHLFAAWIAFWKHWYGITPDSLRFLLSLNLDPNRAGDCPAGWQASLVQAADTWCLFHPTAAPVAIPAPQTRTHRNTHQKAAA